MAEPAAPRPPGFVGVMPRSRDEWRDAQALWITAEGWARAGRRRFGAAVAVLPEGVVEPEELIGGPGERGGGASPASGRRLPEPVVTLAKDVRRWRRAQAFSRQAVDLVPDRPALVWQHHDLFNRAGEAIARHHGAPLVSYVHAPQVWEARRWGVRRSGWGRAVEHLGERPALQHSDVVACVSDEVAAELPRFGVEERRIVVSPMAVDAEHFDRADDRSTVRAQLDLGEATVVGWTGSFRRFHGLEDALVAFAALHSTRPSTVLLLVGDGPTRADVLRQAGSLGIADAVRMMGAVSHREVPSLVAAMDVCLVTGKRDEGFHYSPLKMREYLVTGRPIVGPDVGEVGRVVRSERVGELYRLGDAEDLAAALGRLVDAPPRRAELGGNGRRWVLATGTWDVQLDAVVAALGDLGPVPRRQR